MRAVNHDVVVRNLEREGYNLEFVSDYDREQVNELDDYIDEDAPTHEILDYVEVEGQVYDGLFEDPSNGPEYDFTEFFVSTDQKLVGRMMYYMVSIVGLGYSYEQLVDDVERLSNTSMYDAPFDREKALNANPEEN